MDASKITNVLIFKDGYYYLTINRIVPDSRGYPLGGYSEKTIKEDYQIVPEEWEINNGFEFPGDAYAYLAQLQRTTVGALATVGVGGRKI